MPVPETPPDNCRAFKARTVGTVRRALRFWEDLFGRELPTGFFKSVDGESCGQLAARVKRFLGKDIGVPEEQQFAFQSIKKSLPDSCPCMENGMVDRLKEKISSPGPQITEEYMWFVRTEVRKLFKPNWDRRYTDNCFSVVPPLSGTTDSGRASGGALSHWQGKQQEFLYQVTAGGNVPPVRASLITVQSAGKPRVLTKFGPEVLVLKPLHDTIYDHISKKDWLLRGDVRTEEFGEFSPEKGRIVSGDYESATDNLSVEVAEEVLRTLLDSAWNVPMSIKQYALNILRPTLTDPLTGEAFVVTRGQMMGSLLSFPLLCIQNFLAFKYALFKSEVREKVPVKINGDDIIFQEPHVGFFDKWVQVVGSVGLKVEASKTSVSSEYGSLNSTLLKWRKRALVPVHTFRFGMLRRPDYPNGLGKSFERFVGPQWKRIAWNAAKVFFEAHASFLSYSSADKYGFRGKMAYRLSKLYSHSPRSHIEADLPVPPTPHNVLLNSDEFVELEPERVGYELADLNVRETIRWRWEISFTAADTRALKKRYWQRMREIRETYLKYESDWVGRWSKKKRFMVASGPKMVRVWSKLVDGTSPPPYCSAIDPLSWIIEDPPSYFGDHMDAAITLKWGALSSGDVPAWNPDLGTYVLSDDQKKGQN